MYDYLLTFKMSLKNPSLYHLAVHTPKKGKQFCVLNCSTSANLVKKGPPIDKNVNLQVWAEFKMLRTKIASKLRRFFT
jgi:hypothetical protein